MTKTGKRKITYMITSVIGTALGYTLYKSIEGERNEIIANAIEYAIQGLNYLLAFFK